MKKFINKIKELGFKGILSINLGLMCCALATVILITPSKMVVGGGTGLAVFISMLTNIDYYYYQYAINAILIIVSFFALGKEFTVKTIYGSIMLPTFGMLITKICQWVEYDTHQMVDGIEPIFVVVVAACLMGFGIGINMRNGGSTGGFDILEAILLKYFHIPYSTSILGLDIILVVLGMAFYKVPEQHVVFENWLAEGLGATMYIVILGIVVDTITFGGYNKRAVFIRSTKYEEVHDAIINKLVRGLTYINAEGGYSLTPTKMIICICYSKEYFVLRDMVQEIDPNAFIFVTKSTEVRGLGFNYETPEYLAKRESKLNKRKEKNEL